MKAYQDNLLKELIVDNFAGGGGASVGIELATGRPVDIAVNHDADAIAMHKVNHPYTKHYQEDVFEIEPEKVTNGRKVGIAWFSPDCRHFSRAKGDKPVEKKIRGLSWIVLKWAMSKVAPRCIFMENVEEIKTWGPLKWSEEKQHLVPDEKRSGETFNGFISMLTTGIDKQHPAFIEACEFLKIDVESSGADKLSRGLGYKVDYKTLRACDYGAPTIRKRFYLVARNDGQPIVFPKPTHGDGKGLKPFRTAAECIDWTIPCPSIFDRKKDLAVNTQRRIARGLDKFVLKNPRPYIMEMNFNNPPQDPLKPMSTQTSANHHYIINPAIVPVGYGENKGQKPRVNDISEPLSTVVSTCKQNLSMPFLSKYFSGEKQKGVDIRQPTPTVTAIDHNALVVTYLQKIDTTQDLKNWHKVRKLLNDYAGYNIAEDEILILEINGVQHFISDIGMRMLKAKELKLAQGFPIDYVIDIEPYIGKKYSEAKQIARLGNAVCPPVATALIRANVVDMAYEKPLTTIKELETAMCG